VTSPSVLTADAERRRARLGETLIEMDVISHDQLDSALRVQRGEFPARRLGQVLTDLGLASELDVARGLATIHGLPLVEVELLNIDQTVARLVPRHTAETWKILAYQQGGETMSVAVADPVDVVALDDLRRLTGVSTLIVGVATQTSIKAALAQVWSESEDLRAVRDFITENPDQRPEDGPANDNDAATIRLVDRLLSLAAREGASDIHVEPQRSSVRIRIRVDGVLREVMELPRAGYSALTARLKIVSQLDVIERRVPQDGRARIRSGANVIDMRVSTLPSMHGEKVVVRLLPAAAGLPTLSGLGLSDGQRETILDVARRPQGLILVTGPTGSGKTNTLYATIAEGIATDRNVITLEDPVEIELPGLTQVQIDDRTGLTFARVLRAALRQDPDVILLGEIRDHETAELAVRASLTGHLVLSTLHTLDAVSAVTRLTDMGVAPYLVTASLSLVMSQRLLRVPCAECSSPDPDVASVLEDLGLTGDYPDGWVHVSGCPACRQTGYKGRSAALELLTITPAIRRALLDHADEDRVRRIAHEEGFQSLLDVAALKASEGLTTLAEVLRAIPRQA
jgi:type IV pilus assembly protein PilB